MAIAQDTFNLYRGVAYDGQISTIEVSEVLSRTVEDAAVPFGRAVIHGVGTRTCTLPDGASAGDIIGFSVRSMGVENSALGIAEYAVDKVASVLSDGPMYATCIGGASAGDTVHVVINTAGGEELGQLRGEAETTNTVELATVKWVEDVTDGAIGEIRVHGIFS